MVEEAFAVSEMDVPAVIPDATLTVIVKLAEAPEARLAIEQEIVPVPPDAGVMQLHPATLEMELNVKFAGLEGSVSLSTTLLAAAGPLFITVTT